MLTKLLTIAVIATISNTDTTKTYVATFDATQNGIAGTVTVDNGQVEVSLDLSELNGDLLPDGYSTCTTDGLAYHIHQKWTHDDDYDRVGSINCNATYTGGHMDPWAACAGASGNAYCLPVDTAESDGNCIPKASYSDYLDFPTNFTSAEIGDWSSKYGKITVGTDKMISRTDSSFYEVLPRELVGSAVVFHCNGGSRAFCAPFIESDTDTSAAIPAQTTATKTVMASFDKLSDDSGIIFYPNGNVNIVLDAIEYFSDTTNEWGCDEFEYGIFFAGTESFEEESNGNALGDACDNKVGAQYDPTNACLPWSDRPFCIRDGKNSGALCGDDTYSYVCDFDNNRFSCAPGDLSGKFGKLLNPGTTAKEFNYDESDSLIPPTDVLIGKVVAITCPKKIDDTSPTVFACATIAEYNGVSQISFGMAFVVSFIALFY